MKRTATAMIVVWAAAACTSSVLGLDKQARIQATVGPGQVVSHVITATAAGALLAELSWDNKNIDLDLYITDTTCQADPLTNCTVLAASSRILSTREATGINVAEAEQYKIWVANLDDDRSADYGLDYSVTP